MRSDHPNAAGPNGTSAVRRRAKDPRGNWGFPHCVRDDNPLDLCGYDQVCALTRKRSAPSLFGGRLFGGRLFGGRLFGGRLFSGRLFSGRFFSGSFFSGRLFGGRFFGGRLFGAGFGRRIVAKGRERGPVYCLARRRPHFKCMAHLLFEFAWIEWFIDVRVGLVERARDGIQRLADARQHDDAGMRERDVFADFFADFPAAHLRHHHVKHHQIRQVHARELPRFAAVVGLNDIKSWFRHRAQITGDEVVHGGFIVSNKYEGIRGHVGIQPDPHPTGQGPPSRPRRLLTTPLPPRLRTPVPVGR
jgi:hypothetical protein